MSLLLWAALLADEEQEVTAEQVDLGLELFEVTTPPRVAAPVDLGLELLPVRTSDEPVVSQPVDLGLELLPLSPPQSFTLAGISDNTVMGHGRLVHEFSEDPATPPPAAPPAPGVVLPALAVQLVSAAGAHVGWLQQRRDTAARRSVDGVGSVTTSVQHTDPAMGQVAWDARLRVWHRGEVFQSALIKPRDDSTLAPGEENDQRAQIGGRGPLALLDQWMAHPIRLTLQPVQNSIRHNFGHPDYDDSAWIHAKTLRRLIDAYAAGDETPGPRWGMRLDEWWTMQAEVIGPLEGTLTDAPVGLWYARKNFTLPSAMTLWFQIAADGPAEIYLDGALIKDTGPPEHGLTEIFEVLLDLDAGEHTIAAVIRNRPWTPGLNPTGFLLGALQGRPGGPPVLWTDSTWKILAYPERTPGWTVGEIVNWHLDRGVERGMPPVERGYGTKVDASGRPWRIIPDFTIDCTATSLLGLVQKLAESEVDVRMTPVGDRLELWNKTRRGKRRNLTLSNTGDNPSLTRLAHRTEPPQASDVLLRWSGGYLRRSVSRPWRREAALHLPTTLSEQQARRVGDDVLGIIGHERVRFEAGVLVRNEAQRPGSGFEEGDWIWLPDRGLTPTEVRVLDIGLAEPEDGLRTDYDLVAGDRVMNEDERLKAWLQTKEPGTIGGRVMAAQPTRRDLAISTRAVPVAEQTPFSLSGPLFPGPSGVVFRPPWRMLFVRWVADLGTAGTTGTVLRVLRNEVSNPAWTWTVPAGEVTGSVVTAIEGSNVDRFQIEIVTAGVNAEDLTVVPIARRVT